MTRISNSLHYLFFYVKKKYDGLRATNLIANTKDNWRIWFLFTSHHIYQKHSSNLQVNPTYKTFKINKRKERNINKINK